MRLRILLLLMWLVVLSASVMADPKPLVVSMGEVHGTEVGAILPPAQYIAALILCLQIIFKLVDMIAKRKDKNTERVSYETIIELVHRLDEKVKALPSEDDIVRRIRSEMELIAMKTARSELERRTP